MSFTASLDDIIRRNSSGLLEKHTDWERVPLSDIASVLNGFPFDSKRFSNERGKPLIRIRDIVRGSTETFFHGDFDEQYVMHKGDLLVGMDGDFNCALWQGGEGLLNQRVCRITPNERYYSKNFLAYVLPSYLAAINSATSSITVKHLSSYTVAAIPLPLPPLPEQHRIVAEIERQFSLLDAGVANLKRVQANLKRYRAAVLQAACTGQLIPTEAELAQAEGRAYEPANVLLTRILDERRARWGAEQWAKKKGQSKASGLDHFFGKEVVNRLEHPTLNQGASASPGTSPLSPEWAAEGHSAVEPLTFNESVSGLDTPGVAAGSVVDQLFRKQEGSGLDKEHPRLFSRQFRYDLKGYKEPAAPDTSGLPELPEGWVWTNIDSALVFITSGSRGWAQYYSDKGVLFVRIGNLSRGTTNLKMSDIQRVEPPESNEGARTRLTPGDILVSITANLGSIGLVPEGFEEAYINQHIALCRTVQAIDRKFLSWYLVSEDGQSRLNHLKRGATKIGLGLDDIRAVSLPLPPLAEQSRIVAEVERRLSVVDNLEQVVKANLKRAERLRQAILKEAFAGRLVPQDPIDEPASVLLERIKAEREASRVGGQPGRRHMARNGKRHQEQSTEVTQNLFSAEVTD